eukprot:7708503-Ditylum_brightwellii.AAC.1
MILKKRQQQVVCAFTSFALLLFHWAWLVPLMYTACISASSVSHQKYHKKHGQCPCNQDSLTTSCHVYMTL